MRFLSITILLVLSVYLTSCKNEVKNTKKKSITSSVKYAKGFDIYEQGNQKKLVINNPFPDATSTFEYILTTKKPELLNHLKIPLNSIVVTSTTHISMLDLLDVQNKLVGFPNTNFISSKKTRKLIEQNRIKELGHPENINIETLLDLHPDAVIGFSLNSNNKMFNTIEKIGIPVIFNGDWLEETPLGRAEWIKFFGVLFNKEKQADSIFNRIEKDYLEIKNMAKNSKNKPSVISGGLYKNVWYLPAGESFEASLLKDANTNYLWKDSKGKGSLSLNIENVFIKGKDADIWLSPGFFKTRNDLKNENSISSKMKAFKNKKVYSYTNNKGEKGGIWYFELSPTRPDLVLKDLIKIAHPELLPNYEFTFYDKLN